MDSLQRLQNTGVVAASVLPQIVAAYARLSKESAQITLPDPEQAVKASFAYATSFLNALAKLAEEVKATEEANNAGN